jgi:hypothetical protein
MKVQELFEKLYKCPNEAAVDRVIGQHPDIFKQANWFPYGDNESNFGVIGNQQENPIAALVEKIINSIDAVLMRKCLEAKINPKSAAAPQSMEAAIKQFFPNAANWDLTSFRKQQAESIQIIADGPRMDTSLVIYDDGEGQRPEDFEKTLLSLLRGNKNEIAFVQGKYNMGGSGALVFCGKKRYQLVGSKRFDGKGKFGFTLIRRHPLSDVEKQTRKETWYEFLKLDGEIPAFESTELDLGLHNRSFKTGTIIKLYSYDLPVGSRSVISRDLNQSLNEYLFEPALPIYTIDRKERYPDDRNLQRELYGLKRRLEESTSRKYVEELLSLQFTDQEFGETYVTCYLFKVEADGKAIKETKETVQREFFKNNMTVLFSLNGQVHGHYTSEFITRSLKYPLFKDYLLIHVDCTKMDYEFRRELFMASRDRLKSGEESRQLREKLTATLRKSRLDELYKRRKEAISIGTGEANDLLKSFTKNLPLNSELLSLLNQTFKLEEQKPKPAKSSKSEAKSEKKERRLFSPQRFPSFLRLSKNNDGETPVAQIPLGGDRILQFETDVENAYFDRAEDPGTLQIELLNLTPNDRQGGNRIGLPNKTEDVFNVVRSNPHDGTIKVVLSPTENVKVDEAAQIKVTLSGAGEDFSQIFWVKIIDKERAAEKVVAKDEEEQIGLPECVRVYKDKREGFADWEALRSSGIEMNFDTVMHPFVEGDKLEKIFVNMDSSVLKNYRSKLRGGEEQFEFADKKYLSSVYFHTLFLYVISKNRNFGFTQGESDEPRETSDYLKEIFESYYGMFLLNFGTDQLIQALE